jgi:thioredoxin-related protein
MKKLLIFLAATLALPLFAVEFPKGNPPFSTDYKTALQTAKKENKPLVIVFSSEFCSPCKAMLKSVYPSKKVTPLHDQFVWVYVDTDVEENIPIVEKYQVAVTPHIQFLSATGKPLGVQAGATEAREFAGLLGTVLAKAK